MKVETKNSLNFSFSIYIFIIHQTKNEQVNELLGDLTSWHLQVESRFSYTIQCCCLWPKRRRHFHGCLWHQKCAPNKNKEQN